MKIAGSTIESASVGDPACFPTWAELEEGLAALPAAPRDEGAVRLLLRRGRGGRREYPERVQLDVRAGVPGDKWSRRARSSTDSQLAVMQHDLAVLIAHGQSLGLFGDNLFLELDLSRDNLPTGSRLQVGGAVLEVTPLPHDGCRKFRSRFGEAALRFTADPARRHRNLRGIYLRVVEPGEVAVGDVVRVVRRGGA
ncbi:MAG: hypothetical protein RJA22_646 [Verrucomicrobiota bacterium]|jgi:hypothetical protein